MMNEEDKKILDDITGLNRKPNPRPVLNNALQYNPDDEAENIRMAEEMGLPLDTVRRNRAQLDRKKEVEQFRFDEFQHLEKWLTNEKNANVSVDDIEILKGIEHTLNKPDINTFLNTGKATINRAGKLIGDLVEFAGNAGNALVESTGLPNTGVYIHEDGTPEFMWDMPTDDTQLLVDAGKTLSEDMKLDYVPEFTWENLKGDVTVTNLAGYVFEQGVQSVPDMIAAMKTLPLYIASRTEGIAEERVKNDEREDVTGGDLGEAFVPAVTVAIIERLAAQITFGTGGVSTPLDVLKQAGIATVTEGGTEFVQEGIEYLGETVGTKKPVLFDEMIDRQFAGLVAGAGMGGSIRGVTATYEAIAQRSINNIKQKIQTTDEQQTIDDVVMYAQQSRLNARMQDRFADFLRANNSPREVYISQEGIEALGENVPESIANAMDDIGGEVVLDIATFASKIASDADVMQILRPHVRMSSESLTLSEMESHELDIQNLVARAEQNKQMKDEAEAIYEQVKQQLVDTGRQSDLTARYSAAIIPAYVTVKAEQYGLTPTQVYERMGLTITGPQGTGTVDGETLLNQEGNSTAQEFKDALSSARALNPNAPSVAEYDVTEYENMATYLLDDGKVGYAIESDGNLVGVFKSPESTMTSAMDTIMPEAIANGATKLNAFEGPLTEMYAKHGFVEVDRDPWNEQFRPEGWTDEMGTPDVVYMELQNEGTNEGTVLNQSRVRSGTSQASGEGRGRLQALEDAPSVEGINGPIEELVNVAEQYALANGIDLKRQSQYVDVDPERATRIAEAYEQMENAPNDPVVREAYENMIAQTMDQYQALVDAGYEFWFVDLSNDSNLEYISSPWNAMRDIAQNKQMGVFPTNEGFGSDAQFDATKNPLLADTGIEWPVGGPDGPKATVYANDLFRAVHDAFGHGLEGAGFRARGEENAWQAHVRLFTGSAVGAITSETRGQNSWVNYGPNGEANRTASAEDTVFADQKVGLMPEWTWTEGRAADVDPELKIFRQAERNSIGLYSGVEKAVLDLNIPNWGKKSTKKKPAVVKLDAEIARLRQEQKDNDEKFQKAMDDIMASDNPDQAELDRLDDALSDTGVEKQINELRRQRNIEATPRASGKEIWQKLKKEAGVKQEELEWIGIEEYLLSATEKLSREEVAAFVQQNGVNVQETVADGDSAEDAINNLEFSWGEGDPDMDSENWEYRVENIEMMAKENRDDIWDEAMEYVIEQERDYIDDSKDPDMSDEDYVEMELMEALDDRIEYLARQMAEQDYEENPVMMYELIISDDSGNDLAEGFPTILKGNDDQGYIVTNEMGYSIVEEVWSRDEALIQTRSYFSENDYLRDDMGGDENTPKWEEYVTDGDYDNYRELKLKLPDITPEFEYNVHFDDANIVAFLRVTDRDLVVRDGRLVDIPDKTITPEWSLERIPEDDPSVHKGMRKVIITDKETGDVIKSLIPNQQFRDSSDVEAIEKYKEFISGKDGQFRGDDYRTYTVKNGSISLENQGQQWVDENGNPIDGIEKDTYFIDEFQSDWHQQGRDRGYVQNLSNEQLQELSNEEIETTSRYEQQARIYLRKFAPEVGLTDLQNGEFEMTNEQAQRIDFSEDEFVNMLSELATNNFKHAYEGGTKRRYDKVIEIAELIGSFDKEWIYGVRDTVNKIKRLKKQQKAGQSGVPDAPFKGNNWLNLGLKRALVDAVDQGKDAFAWADSNVLSDRWSDQYQKLYETQYDTKMTSMVKKLTKQQPVHLNMEGEPHQHQELGYWVIELTPELKEQIKRDSFSLFQKDRGSIQFANDDAIIKLTKASDLSTFLHESGHLFLEMEGKFAQEFGISDDQQTILDWLEVDSFADIKTEQHEKFARGFEAYTREGKAPSRALRDAFMAFRRWLTRIYQNIRQLDVTLNDDIRGVMDRMLATDAEIQDLQTSPAFEELFRSKEQAGMTDAEWDKYQKQLEKREAATTSSIDEKLLKELTRMRTKEWDEEKAPLIDEAMEQLAQKPVYQVIQDARSYPMDYTALKNIVGFDKLAGKLIGVAKKDGVDPQEYAEVYGFKNVNQMYNAMVDTPTLKQAAEEQAQAQMVAKYGDILNDGTIEAEAREAAHNEEQAALLLMELKALKPPRARELNAATIKAEAKRIISKMTYKEIKPNKYYRAQIKAAQNAAKATDKAEQYRHKLQQMVNHHLYKEAVATREAMIKQRRYVRKAQTREYNAKQVAPEYIQNIKTVANMYDMRNKNAQTVALDNILNWYETQINDENQFVNLELLDVNLIRALEAKNDGVLSDITLPKFDDLSAEDLQGLYDMLRHMRYVGGTMSDTTKAEFKATVESIVDTIIKKGGKDVKDKAGRKTRGTDIRRKVSHMLNALPSLRNLVRKLEGFDDGVIFETIYQGIEQGNSDKMRMQKDVYERFTTELNDIHKVGLVNNDGKSYLLESGLSVDITSEQRFMMALYWGTESSRDAIRDGYGMSDADVSRILSDMTTEQINLLNAVWKVNESMWPELSKASVKMYGVAPPKLENTPFELNGIALTGGHMRLIYDSFDIEVKTAQEQGSKMQSVVPSRAGSLYERVGSGGKPVLLEVNNITRALEDSVHFIAFAEPARTIGSIVNSKEVKSAIEQKHGRGFLQALMQNIENITANHPAREAYAGLGAMFRLLRKAATFKHLAYSLRNTVQQITALPVAMEEVGVTNMLGAIGKISTPNGFREVATFVNERSKFMENRASVVNREANEYLSKVKISGPIEHIWEQFNRFGFTPQTIVDSVIAYPAWIAKYESAMANHGDETRAVSEADTAVAESVGSGSDLHLGGAFQSNQSELVRTLTMFGTWFNAYYQRMYKSTEGFTTAQPSTVMTMLVTPFIVAILSAIVIMDMPDEQDEPEDYAKWMAQKYGEFMFGTIPIARDAVSSFKGFDQKTVLADAVAIPYRLTNEVQNYYAGEQSGVKTASDLFKIGTTVVPVAGAGNVTRVLDFVDSNQQGNETGTPVKKTYQALVEGPNRND